MALHLGFNLWRPAHPPAEITPEALLGNTWLIGQTGKSTLLQYLARQMAHQNLGFAYIDPLSQSVPTLLHQIPDSRKGDVVYLNPLADDVIPWNPLEDLTLQQDKVASEMVFLLETMLESGSFLYRSQDLLKMSVLALNGLRDATLLHIPKLLIDDSWQRHIIVPKLTRPIRAFWEDEYETWIKERQRNTGIAALMNKLRIFTTSNPLRDILCAKERITPRQITQGKILLCDLQARDLGQLETTVLASLLLARLSIAATRPYIVFVDNSEYLSQGILTSALGNPNIGVMMAHTYGGQVNMDAVMSQTANIFAFQVNTTDARQLEQLLPPNVQVSHLVDQRPYTCYAKVGQQVFRLQTLPPFTGGYGQSHAHILQQSRRKYARPRKDVRDYLRHVVS